jgi:hypothetical protein
LLPVIAKEQRLRACGFDTRLARTL